MTILRFIRPTTLAVVLCLTGAACTSTTSPTEANSTITPLVFVTQTFSGTLDLKGTGFYSFSVTQAGPVGLTLAAVQSPGGAALATPLGIGVGVPSGAGCARDQHHRPWCQGWRRN